MQESVDSTYGILNKVSAPCLRCNENVTGYLIPDGRFICPNCDPPAVYNRWQRTWAPFEKVERRNPFRIRVHLSTIVLIVIVSGLLLGLNVRNVKSPRIPETPQSKIEEALQHLQKSMFPSIDEIGKYVNENHFGWPFFFGTSNRTYDGPHEITLDYHGKFITGKERLEITVAGQECSVHSKISDLDGTEINSEIGIDLEAHRPIKALPLCGDVLVGLTIVILLGAFVEWLIHRGEAKRHV